MPTATDKPFILHAAPRSGAQAAGARLEITPSLRTSGFLRALPDGELRTLLFLLTFLAPDGCIYLSRPELAEAMQMREGRAEWLLERLCRFEWQGKPAVSRIVSADARSNFMLSWEIAQTLPAPEEPVEEPRQPPIRSSYDAVIAHSRAVYARPRAEVEEIVRAQLGYKEVVYLAGEAGELQRKLEAVGVPHAQAEQVCAEFPLAEVRDQVAWLPQRFAKNPARFVVAAIRGRYKPPPGVEPSKTQVLPLDIGDELLLPLPDEQ